MSGSNPQLNLWTFALTNSIPDPIFLTLLFGTEYFLFYQPKKWEGDLEID